MEIINEFKAESHLPELSVHIPKFLESRIKELETLKSLVHESNYDDILKVVHDWKGYCEPYGFSALIEIGSILESCAQIRNPQKCYSAIEIIADYLKFKESSLKK